MTPRWKVEIFNSAISNCLLKIPSHAASHRDGIFQIRIDYVENARVLCLLDNVKKYLSHPTGHTDEIGTRGAVAGRPTLPSGLRTAILFFQMYIVSVFLQHFNNPGGFPPGFSS